MNQISTGQFIAKIRKEKNLTQEQLAERLGVSNKMVSKWETGKHMPDYSIVEALCQELDISVAELMDGKKSETDSVRLYDEEQILELMSRVQLLEKQKQKLTGTVLIVMGIALLVISQVIGGTDFRDFIAGILLGLSIGEMLVGVYGVGSAL